MALRITKFIRPVAMTTALLTSTLPAGADDATTLAAADDLANPPPNAPPPPTYLPPPMTPSSVQAAATPSAPAPTSASTTPPASAPPTIVDVQPASAPGTPPPAANGQWVYTTQYGWIWSPYAQAYTYVSPGSEAAYTFVYYPSFGWRWVWSPWVFGWGPHPYWGVHGRAHFVWYSRPWFHARYAPGYAHYGRYAPRTYAHPAPHASYHGRGAGHGHRR